MAEQEKQESALHNDADKMVYEFKNSDNDPNRELTEAEAEKRLQERTGAETDESASTKSSTKTPTTKSTSTSKEK